MKRCTANKKSFGDRKRHIPASRAKVTKVKVATKQKAATSMLCKIKMLSKVTTKFRAEAAGVKLWQQMCHLHYNFPIYAAVEKHKNVLTLKFH